MERYVVLPRLIPIDGGQLFVYGDRGVAFGNLNISQSLLSALGVDRLERARNPVARVMSVAIFDREGANYTSSAQVCMDGDRGWMFAINGSGFYDAMQTDLPALMAELEVTSLEGYVVPGHSRLMARALRRVGRVMRTGQGRMNGHVMDWVIVRAA
ncbi:MAG: hypothetical protein ACOY9J_13385 [Pseudomonadota bacterium]